MTRCQYVSSLTTGFTTGHERGNEYAQKVFSRLVAHGSEHANEVTSLCRDFHDHSKTSPTLSQSHTVICAKKGPVPKRPYAHEMLGWRAFERGSSVTEPAYPHARGLYALYRETVKARDAFESPRPVAGVDFCLWPGNRKS